MIPVVMEWKNLRTAWSYLARASRLRCPVCGVSPIFAPVSRIRRLADWFEPLDGCPRCGYPYDREPGYFLLAIWGINYGCGSLLGLMLYLIYELAFDWPVTRLIVATLVPVLVFNLMFARHAKAYFIAFDHFCDPHERGGDDGRGNLPVDPRPPAPDNPKSKPVAPEPCETLSGMR